MQEELLPSISDWSCWSVWVVSTSQMVVCGHRLKGQTCPLAIIFSQWISWLFHNYLPECIPSINSSLKTDHQRQFHTFWSNFDLQVGFLYYYIISVIMISATVIPKSSRLGPDKDLAITVLWAVQTKKKIKSLFSRLIRHISDEKCERWASRKKNNKKYKLVS